MWETSVQTLNLLLFWRCRCRRRRRRRFVGCSNTGSKNVQFVFQHCCKTSWIAMLRVSPPTFKPVSQQIWLMQVAKRCCRKKRVVRLFATKSVTPCCAFYRPKANLFFRKCCNPRVCRDFRVILSIKSHIHVSCNNCKTGLNMCGETCIIALQLVLQQSCKTNCTCLLSVLP